jgi:hypothetical protein
MEQALQRRTSSVPGGASLLVNTNSTAAPNTVASPKAEPKTFTKDLVADKIQETKNNLVRVLKKKTVSLGSYLSPFSLPVSIFFF